MIAAGSIWIYGVCMAAIMNRRQSRDVRVCELVVAVLIGYFWRRNAGAANDIGGLFVLVSVVVIMMTLRESPWRPR
jgi:hypothetical protein